MSKEIEELAESIYREYPNNPKDKPDWYYNKDIHCFKKRKAFVLGAKYQENFTFTNEEVIMILQKRLLSIGIFPSLKSTEIWFNQYKK